MESSHKHVIFISQRDAEKIKPGENWALISITDSEDYLPELQDGWFEIKRYHFIDGDYDEGSLRYVGKNYKYIFSSYFNRELALKMIEEIANIVGKNPSAVVVHCHAGRSRSAAVAKFIHDKYGYIPYNTAEVLNLPKEARPPPDFSVFGKMNTLVYKLLDNPNVFDGVINEIEILNLSKEHPRTLYQRVISILSSLR